jgi:SAM-dependent methyltransferase
MSDPDVLRGYAVDAAELIPQFEAIQTVQFLAPVAALLPKDPSRVLEVGAGTGRDAAWLVEKGHYVVAVEPVDELREAGMVLHPSDQIEWVKDTLPALRQLRGDSSAYDLVLALAVWQHLPPRKHRQAIGILADKAAPRGRLIISLRHGPGSPSRPCYPASPERIVGYGEEAGLRLLLRCSAASIQQRNRDLGVTWTWLCFERL